MRGLSARMGIIDPVPTAGKLSDLISKIEGTRRIDPLVRKAMGGKA
jgi:hypothetical protein